jgi:hypothetical protein
MSLLPLSLPSLTQISHNHRAEHFKIHAADRVTLSNTSYCVKGPEVRYMCL